MLPSTEAARHMYLAQGGNLTDYSICGMDPLPDLVWRRDALFHERNPTWQQIFSNVASGDGEMLKQAILRASK